MAEGDTLANAVIGGIASILLGFVPFSPVLGGAVAGYLHGGERGIGVRIGAYAGIIAAIPFALALFFAIAVFGFLLSIGTGSGAALLFFVLFALVAAAVYTVGFSALGGWLGNYVRYDTDLLK